MRPINAALAGAITLSTAVLWTGSAAAVPPNTIRGGCYFETYETEHWHYEGVYGDLSATTDSLGLPVGARVTCWVLINGLKMPETGDSWSGVGAQAGSDPLEYDAVDGDLITVCQHVDYADGTQDDNC